MNKYFDRIIDKLLSELYCLLQSIFYVKICEKKNMFQDEKNLISYQNNKIMERRKNIFIDDEPVYISGQIKKCKKN
jgi:hypothetical protein